MQSDQEPIALSHTVAGALAPAAGFHDLVDEVMIFLKNLCGIVLAGDTVVALLSGRLGRHDLTDPGIAAWARAEAGSYGWPTFTPARGVTAPPRMLLLGEASVDNLCAAEQWNAYGADVIGPVPECNVMDPELGRSKRMAELVRLAATVDCDLAWLELDDARALEFVADLLRQRRVPTVIGFTRPPVLSSKTVARAVVLPSHVMLEELGDVLESVIPPGLSARLDLSRPLVAGWHGEYLVAEAAIA